MTSPDDQPCRNLPRMGKGRRHMAVVFLKIGRPVTEMQPVLRQDRDLLAVQIAPVRGDRGRAIVAQGTRGPI